MSDIGRQNQHLKILLSLLVLALAFYLILSWLVSRSQSDLLLKASENNQVEVCITGSQSQRARSCPDVVRLVTKALEELKNKCRETQSAYAPVYFNGVDYDCDTAHALNQKKEQLLRAIRR